MKEPLTEEELEERRNKVRRYRDENRSKLFKVNDCDICGGKYQTIAKPIHYRTRMHIDAEEKNRYMLRQIRRMKKKKEEEEANQILE